MLFKLSLTGLKSRFKDYAVLFSGLTLSAAIFYMFLTMATNQEYLKGASVISAQTTKLAFGLGIVLLSIITFVYLVYANSFLLSMRKKDYGTYMMLGAKNSKIGQLIFIETLVVGLLAAVIGCLIGIGLAQWLSGLLVKQLGLAVHGFYGFYVPALFWTLVFYAIIFFLASLWNRRKLVKSNLINLLHEDQKPIKLRKHPILKTFEAVIGILLLAAGYWAMASYATLQTESLWIGLITIILGSFFVFDSFFSGMIAILQKNKKFKYHGLNSFTLGQLKFRLTDYTRILSVISILFALALGAITVGLNFKNMADQTLDATYYDAVLYRKTPAVKQQLKKIPVQKEISFDYKVVNKKNTQHIYVDGALLAKKKIHFVHYAMKNGQPVYKNRLFDVKALNGQVKSETQVENNSNFASLTVYGEGIVQAVSKQKYAQIKAPVRTTSLLQVANFKQHYKQLEKLQKLATPTGKDIFIDESAQKATSYVLINNMASGFEFMGFFLGIAFLAMLASTLMFKVLSGANSDKPRYEMLYKIGSHKRALKNSIAKEIGILFLLPAVLGVIDVLFGLQFFKALLANPYDKIWIPFTLFFVLYLIYYVITVVLYQNIVLKKK